MAMKDFEGLSDIIEHFQKPYLANHLAVFSYHLWKTKTSLALDLLPRLGFSGSAS